MKGSNTWPRMASRRYQRSVNGIWKTVITYFRLRGRSSGGSRSRRENYVVAVQHTATSLTITQLFTLILVDRVLIPLSLRCRSQNRQIALHLQWGSSVRLYCQFQKNYILNWGRKIDAGMAVCPNAFQRF